MRLGRGLSMSDSGNGSQAFHQGVNAAAFFGIFFLWNYEVISGGVAIFLMLAMIGFYLYRHG